VLTLKTFFLTLLSTLVILAACSSAKNNGIEPTQSEKKETALSGGIRQWTFFCDPSGLSTEERKRWLSLHEKLRVTRREVRELPDGYAYRYASDAGVIREIAEFITFERRCCPFFEFNVAIERDAGAIWMSLRGPEGVKEFIRSEFGV
jgi:hypothetical protein